MVENIFGQGESKLSETISSLRLERPYRYQKGEFIVEKMMTAPGVEINRKHQEDNIDYSDIDLGIRELIKNINNLPFLATVACCEGHLINTDKNGVALPADLSRLWGGWLSFLFDPRLSDTTIFLNRVDEMKTKFSFVGMEFHNCPLISEVLKYPSNDCYGLPYCSLSFEDSEGEIIRKQSGIKQINQHKKFWSELSLLVQEINIDKNTNL